MSVPVMRMGLIGFSAEQEEYLRNVLKTRSAKLQWEPAPVLEADALWVNGARAQLARTGLVRIPAGQAASRATQLNLKDVDRPLAFTLPLASADILPPYSFDPRSVESITSILQNFEAWLQPIAAQLVLAKAIASMEASLTSRVYHLTLQGTLIAIVNIGADTVGLSPNAALADFGNADWSGRPSAAHEMPDQFLRCRLSEMMWHFAVRSEANLLPSRYRASTIYFRRSPRIPQKLLKDTHLVLLRELEAASSTFTELQHKTGHGDDQLARALAALYFVGCITANPRRAAPPSSRRAREPGEPSAMSMAPSMLEGDSAYKPDDDGQAVDWTVAAPLSPRG